MTHNYPDFRTYGKPPYNIALVHGGPGGPGEMAPVAEKLSGIKSVLEPLQKQDTVMGQASELMHILYQNCALPLTLIGWSWGAFLSLIVAAQNPKLIKKLILISSGPLEEHYAKQIKETRLSRMSEMTKRDIDVIEKHLSDPKVIDKDPYIKEYTRLTFLADAYEPIVTTSLPIAFQYELHQKVWNEAHKLRISGQLLSYAASLSIPVVAIHGDYDAHPYQGVKEPLTRLIPHFKFILLEECGHYPWYEKKAKDTFYKVLENELTN